MVKLGYVRLGQVSLC